MNFAVTVVTLPGYLHSAAFSEVAETLCYGLRSLGHDCVLSTDANIPGRQHIVLGANLLPDYALPVAPDAILYNLEQVQAGPPWFTPQHIDLYRRHVVWDYSEQNVTRFAALGIHVSRVMPMGYIGEMTRIEHEDHADIDVLFFGSMGPRRHATIERMRALGLRVEAVFGVYGQARDALIARAKVVLNVHHYEAHVLEVVRISYLLANKCVVLSERSSNPADDNAFSQGVAFADYDDLPQVARALIDAPDECERISRRGFELMQSRPIVNYLRAALAEIEG